MRRSVTISLADQGVLSLFNLGVNLALIKFAQPVEFGQFIYALTLILIMTSLQNALVQTPIAVMLPGRGPSQRRSGLKAIVSFDLGLRLLCAAIAAALCMLTHWTPLFLAAVFLAVFTTLARETARNIYIASDRVRYCFRLDLVAVAISAVVITAGWRFYDPAIVSLAGIALGNAVALAISARGVIPGRLKPAAIIPAYGKFWAKTQWSLIGAATTEVQYRNYIFAVEFFRGTSVLASVQAGRLLLGPLALIVQSWARVARPAMAKALARGDRRDALDMLLAGLALVAGVGVVYCGSLWAAWPWLESWIFDGKYPGIALMTLAWGVYALINVFNIGLSSALIAANELRELAYVSIGTALLTCVLLFGLSFDVSPVFAVQVLIAGELVALVWLAVLVMRLFAGLDLFRRPEVPMRSIDGLGR